MIVTLSNRHSFSYIVLLLLIVLWGVPAKTHAQGGESIDSLLTVLSKHPKEDTVRVKILADLAFAYHLISPDSTVLLSKQSYALSQKLNYERGKADALKLWAIASYMQSEYKQAINRNEEALAIYQKINDKKGAGAVLNNIAIIRHNEGDFATALSFYKQSLAIRKEIDDKIGVAACYNNIGNTYSDMGNYSEALYNLFMGLRLREQLSPHGAIGNSLTNIANVYYYLGKDDLALKHALRALDIVKKSRNIDGMISANVVVGAIYHRKKELEEALVYFQDALKLSFDMGNMHNVGLSYNNIGQVYLEQNNYNKAKFYLFNALKISEESGDLESIAINNIGLGQVYLKLHSLDSAIHHLLISNKVALEIGSKLQLSESSDLLAHAYEQQKDFKSATHYYKKFILYKDSLFNDEVAKKSSQIEFDFVLDKKQKEIALLEKDKSIQTGLVERSRLANTSMAIVLCLIGVFAIGLYISFGKVKKANKITTAQKEEILRQAEELKELNQLKDKILSVLSHDLRSPVASLSGIISLLDENMISQQEFLELKNGMNNQLAALSLLLDNLLHWSRSQLEGNTATEKGMVSLPTLVSQNISILQESARQKNINLKLTQPASDIMASVDKSQIDIVLRNLLSNAIKFTNRAGNITVTIEDKGTHILTCITDNGVGMDEQQLQQLFNLRHQSNYGTDGEKGTGLGLLLCKDFVTLNNGTLTVKSTLGTGSTFCITLPKA
ncbi:MAG: tetratricopeptide repeat-containing sensor histidine kinase [Bacteroidota bacterium]